MICYSLSMCLHLDRTNDDINLNLVSQTAVPEPFTIIGTLVGGMAALRLRNKLNGTNKNLD